MHDVMSWVSKQLKICQLLGFSVFGDNKKMDAFSILIEKQTIVQTQTVVSPVKLLS